VAEAKLWLVRVRREPLDWDAPRPTLKTREPFGLSAAFATRAEAEAYQEEAERRAAASGDEGPLCNLGSLADLMALSDFEPGVFRDWLTDHGIPEPETFLSTRRLQEMDHWREWLECLSAQQLADLYAALHRFRFYEIVEVPFVPDDYPQERWDDWEKNLDASRPPDPDEDDYEFEDDQDGFQVPPGWSGLQTGLTLPPPPPIRPDDEIPF
jgi:hypothetical protein